MATEKIIDSIMSEDKSDFTNMLSVLIGTNPTAFEEVPELTTNRDGKIDYMPAGI